MDRDLQRNLERRIERLERGYHTWRRTGLSAIGVVVALLAYGAYTFAQRPGDAPRPAGEPIKVEAAKQAAPEPAKNDGTQVAIDATGMRTTYGNFYRVTGNPEEVLLDFGFYSQVVTPGGPESVKLTDRLVMNFYTAKKLHAVLQTIVSRHEEAYGEIQPDPAKRLRPKKAGD
jgi:hypothetical protein